MDGNRWAEHEHGGVGFVENKEPITSEVSAHQRAPPGTAPRPSTIVPLQQGAKMVDLAGMVKKAQVYHKMRKKPHAATVHDGIRGRRLAAGKWGQVRRDGPAPPCLSLDSEGKQNQQYSGVSPRRLVHLRTSPISACTSSIRSTPGQKARTSSNSPLLPTPIRPVSRPSRTRSPPPAPPTRPPGECPGRPAPGRRGKQLPRRPIPRSGVAG